MIFKYIKAFVNLKIFEYFIVFLNFIKTYDKQTKLQVNDIRNQNVNLSI